MVAEEAGEGRGNPRFADAGGGSGDEESLRRGFHGVRWGLGADGFFECVRDFICHGFDDGGVAAFDEETHFGFGARVPEEDAALTVEGAFGFGEEAGNLR